MRGWGCNTVCGMGDSVKPFWSILIFFISFFFFACESMHTRSLWTEQVMAKRELVPAWNPVPSPDPSLRRSRAYSTKRPADVAAKRPGDLPDGGA